MKILLMHPPWHRFFEGELKEGLVALSYLAAALKKDGYEAVVYNCDFDYNRKRELANFDFYLNYECYMSILGNLQHPIWQEIKAKIIQVNPDIVGISMMSSYFDSALNLAKLVKQIDKNIPVIMGGHHPTAMPESVLKCKEVDIAVRGEGEVTLLELLQRIEKKQDLEGLLGVSYKLDEKFIHNPNRPLIDNLDTIPFPAKENIIDIDKYPNDYLGLIIASRGCPHNCIYCASKIMWGRNVRFRSPDNIVNEIKHTKNRFGTQRFKFLDDTLLANKAHIRGVCDLLIQEKLDIHWSCSAVVNSLDDELLDLMKKAGCFMVCIGIETGDPETMKRIKKGITLDMVKRAVKLLKKHRFQIYGYVMYGFPWETRKQILRTVDFMYGLKIDGIGYSIATPLPGTELLEIIQNNGLLPKDSACIDWSHIYFQSPKMAFTTTLRRDEFKKLIYFVEQKFYYYNLALTRKQLFKYIVSNPKKIIKSFFTKGYYRNLSRIRSLLSKVF